MAEESRMRKQVWANRCIWKGTLKWEEHGPMRETREHSCKILASMLDETLLTPTQNPEKITVEFLDQNILDEVNYAGDDFFQFKVELNCDRQRFLAKYLQSSRQIGLINLLVRGRGQALNRIDVLLTGGGKTGLGLQAQVPKNNEFWSPRIQRWRNRREGIPNLLQPPEAAHELERNVQNRNHEEEVVNQNEVVLAHPAPDNRHDLQDRNSPAMEPLDLSMGPGEPGSAAPPPPLVNLNNDHARLHLPPLMLHNIQQFQRWVSSPHFAATNSAYPSVERED